MNDFFDPMKLSINRKLVKYSAGTAIFCPHCGVIADARHWIVASVGDKTINTCAPCWDKAIAGKDLPQSVEVLDGRVLFGKSKRKVTA